MPDCTKFAVADGDGRCGAPLLIDLEVGREEIDVRFEGRLKFLVPVHQVGQDGKVARIQGVQSGTEDVGNFAFVYKGGHLGLAHGELAAILYFHILHGIAVGEDSLVRLVPLNDVDELLGDELLESHARLRVFLESNSTTQLIGDSRKSGKSSVPGVTYNFLQYVQIALLRVAISWATRQSRSIRICTPGTGSGDGDSPMNKCHRSGHQPN